jgi:predicted nucleotidyltransferase
MAKKQRGTQTTAFPRWYRGTNVPIAVIRRFARQVAERFQPDKIILFGSHAYGTPHADRDVDILVVMPTRNQLEIAFKIHATLLPPFPLHIIVRTPSNLTRRVQEGESFLSAIVAKGKVLYEANLKGSVRTSPERQRRVEATRRRRSGLVGSS